MVDLFEKCTSCDYYFIVSLLRLHIHTCALALRRAHRVDPSWVFRERPRVWRSLWAVSPLCCAVAHPLDPQGLVSAIFLHY